MPEGHVLHRLAIALRPLVGRRVAASSPQGRFADGAAVIDGRVVEGVEAYGKHLFVKFGDVQLHVHLGRAGAMFPSDPAGVPPAGVRLRLVAHGDEVAWNVVAPMRCEILSFPEVDALIGRLGPDALRGDAPGTAFGRISQSGRSIGELLLDQSVVAGVGNVVRAETLHACALHPQRPGASLTADDLACVWATLSRLLRRAVAEGRIISVDSDDGMNRATIAEGDGRFVYKQDRCRRCGADVRSWELAGRTAYACERCQPVVA